MKLSSYIRLWVNRNINAVRLRTWVFLRQNPDLYVVRKNHTQICIEGYPRSANSFSVYLFARANPAVKLAHHTHAIANLIESVRWQIPAIALVREPVDAISSAYLYGPYDLDYHVKYYIEFYSALKNLRNDLVIANFDQIISGGFNNIIQDVNTLYHTSFNYVDNLEKTSQEILDQLKRTEYYTQDLRMDPEVVHRRLQAPHPKKDVLKRQTQPQIMQHPDIGTANNLFQAVIA